MEKLDSGGLDHDAPIRNDRYTVRTSNLLFSQEGMTMGRKARIAHFGRDTRTNPVTDFLQFAAVTVIVVFLASAFFLGLYEVFRIADCHTAQSNLERIAKCEAHP